MLNLLPFHPKIVHFPIALITVAFLFEFLSQLTKKDILSKTAIMMYCFAVIFTPFVVWSGLMEEDRLHLHHAVLNAHKNFAFLTMWVGLFSMGILWFLHKKSEKLFRRVFLAFLLLLTLTITTAAHYGGKMVYEYGAGVNS